MQEINDNPEQLDRFKEEYRGIYDKLRALDEKEEIDKRYLGQLVELTNDLLKVVAKDAEHVKEEVAHMGGQVIVTNTDLLIAYGEEKGIEQTTIDGIIRSMKKQNLSYEDACDFMDIPKEQYKSYRAKVMKKLKEMETLDVP